MKQIILLSLLVTFGFANIQSNVNPATEIQKRVYIQKTLEAPIVHATKHKTRRSNKLVAKIDISQQRMRVYRGNKLLYNWKVSTGKRGFRTPTGNYKPKTMEKMHYSRKYNNAPMPYSVFFRGGYAVHGTRSVKRLGRPASHGCVRLRTSNAKKFYSLIRKAGKRNTSIKIVH